MFNITSWNPQIGLWPFFFLFRTTSSSSLAGLQDLESVSQNKISQDFNAVSKQVDAASAGTASIGHTQLNLLADDGALVCLDGKTQREK